MTPPPLRILHISDLHAAGPRTPAWRWQRVLGDAWKRNLDELLGDGAFDLVCFTGDVANWGKADEYAQASDFLKELLEHLRLPLDRLFVVPGNHDIDRSVGEAAWRALRKGYDRADQRALAGWLMGGKPPPGFKKGQREQLLERQSAYRDWVGKTLGRPELLPENSPHGVLGYRSTVRLPHHPFGIHLIGLDSAWAAGDNHDAGKLLLTDEQVGRLTTGADGKALPGFRLALIHHPLSDLFDGAHARRLLAVNVDLLLRGHLHESTIETLVDPDRISRQLAAGCLYESDRWPNACHAIEVHFDERGRPTRYELRFRTWSPNGHWFDDGGVYREAERGRLSWSPTLLPRQEPPTPPPPRQELLPSPAFVGREDELRRMAIAVLPEDGRRPVPVSIQGMPGVGKTFLAEHFFALHQARFPGGLLRLVLDPQAPQPANLLLRQLAERLGLQMGEAGLAERVRESLRGSRMLLLMENVDSEPTARECAALVHQLPGCQLLVTGRRRGLGASAGWTVIEVPVLEEDQALEQFAREWHPSQFQELRERKTLARDLGYLPLALHLAAGYLRLGGHDVASFLSELRAQKLKLEPTDPAELLRVTPENRERAVLASTFELSLELLRGQLGADAERMLPGLEALGHAPGSGFGVSLGSAVADLPAVDLRRLLHHALQLSIVAQVPRTERPDGAWRIHSLLAEFLRSRSGASEGFSRMTEWFLERLPFEEEQGQRWKEVHSETESLVDWLARVPEIDFVRVEQAGNRYALFNGPYAAWMAFCERALTHPLGVADRSRMLWALGTVAYRGGALDRAFAAADEMLQVERERNEERGVALAARLRADILEVRGQYDQALHLYREEALPIFEKLGDVRERAITLGNISDILQVRGESDEALRIRREEMLPVFEEIGDVRARAIILGKIADIHQAREQHDEALRIRREEELPVYEKLGDVSSHAGTLGKIAESLVARGQHDEALRILREEVLPVFKKLGDVRARALILGQIAHIHQSREQHDEALRIRREEELPVYERLGDIRSRAITLGQIADIHQAREQYGEALRIRRQEQLPALEELGDVRELLIARAMLALLYLQRNQVNDRQQAAGLLRLALEKAEELRLPEAEMIRHTLRRFSLE